MCVPDLRGTQGTFTLYTTESSGLPIEEGGIRVKVEVTDNRVETQLVGPANSLVAGNPEIKIPLTATLKAENGEVNLKVGDAEFSLRPGEYSGWVRLGFPTGTGLKVRGLASTAAWVPSASPR